MTEEKNGFNEIPRSWARVTVNDIALPGKDSIRMGPFGSQLKKGELVGEGIRVLWIENIVDNRFEYKIGKFVTQEKYEELKAFKVSRGELLITMMGTIGRVAIVPDDIGNAIISSHLSRVKIDNRLCNIKYLKYAFLSEQTKKQLNKESRGVVMKGLNTKIIRSLVVPLPPLQEQDLIIRKIEELFSFLDAGTESLRIVQEQLKRYRQTVLKYAFEGKLTMEWRKNHIDIMEKSQVFLKRLLLESNPSRRFILSKMPVEWAWVSLEQLSSNIVDCLHSTAKFTKAGKFCIDTNCIEANRILFDKARRVHEEIFRERVRRLVPQEGDVLFAREGTIGTAVVVPPNVDLCLGQRMMMFRLHEGIVPLYFTWGLLSPIFEMQWKKKVMGTTVPHVNIKDVKQMVLPLTCPEEQEAIANEVEARFSVINYAENTVACSLAKINMLRQSILKTAFEGQLVPQNPDDEPAEKLLERITAERLTNNPNKDNQFELSQYVK